MPDVLIKINGRHQPCGEEAAIPVAEWRHASHDASRPAPGDRLTSSSKTVDDPGIQAFTRILHLLTHRVRLTSLGKGECGERGMDCCLPTRNYKWFLCKSALQNGNQPRRHLLWVSCRVQTVLKFFESVSLFHSFLYIFILYKLILNAFFTKFLLHYLPPVLDVSYPSHSLIPSAIRTDRGGRKESSPS